MTPGLGKYLLLAFAAMQYWASARGVMAEYLGSWVLSSAGVINASSPLLLAGAAIWYCNRYGNPLSQVARAWFAIVVVVVVLNAARSFLAGVLENYVFADTLSFLVILSFVLIGGIPQAFHDMKEVWFWVLLFGIPLNAVGLLDLSVRTDELLMGHRLTRETLSYRTQNIMDVVVLCMAFSYTYPAWKRLVISTGFGLVIVQQVLYQKRLEIFFYLAVLVWVVFIFRSFEGKNSWFSQRIARELAFTVGAIVAVAVITQATVLLAQGGALFERASGSSGEIEYSDGYLKYVLWDNERLTMVRDSFATFSPMELWFGRGMGGAVELVEEIKTFTDDTVAERFAQAYYLPDYGFYGRRGFESGIFVPVLKGGIVLFCIYYSIYLYFFSRRHKMYRSLEGRLCIAVVALQLGYTLFGGDFILVVAYQMGTLAACLGFGISRRLRSHNVVTARVHPLAYANSVNV